MKEEKSQESGRTMLETIAVVILASILIVMSLSVYGFVVKKWRQRQTVDQIGSIAVGMRSGNLAQRYQKDEKIPIRQIVRGMNVAGEYSAKLPDGDESSATVTSLGINKYMLQVKVEPETCVEIIEKAQKGDATFSASVIGITDCDINDNCKEISKSISDIAPDEIESICGVKKNNHASALSLVRSAHAESQKSAVTLSYVWGCEGSSVYFYEGQCAQCPKQRPVWDGTSCCKALDPKTGKCPVPQPSCPPNQPCYDGVLCCAQVNGKCPSVCPNPPPSVCPDPNKPCYDEKNYECCAKNADGTCPTECPIAACQCDTPALNPSTGKCEECMTDADCPKTEFSRHICDTSTHKCVECYNDSHCTGVQNLAPTKCVNGGSYEKCTSAGNCGTCEYPGKMCVKDPSPRDDNWDKKYCQSSTNTCCQCRSDNHCPDNGKCDGCTCSPCIKDYQGNGTLERGECPADAPICKNPGTSQATCSQCNACEVWDSKQKKCVLPEGTLVENGRCVKCIRWDYKGSEYEPNAGCPGKGDGEMKDICIVNPDGVDEYDRICVVCAADYDKNDPGNRARCGNNSQTDLDWKDGLFCSNKENYEAGKTDEEDYTCHKCINDKEDDNERDTGCNDPAHPELIRCNADFGKFGDECLPKEVRTCKAYYYQPDGVKYEPMSDNLCQNYFDTSCANYTGWRFVDGGIGGEPDACVADPCNGYYDHNSKRLSAEEAQSVRATPATCPLSTLANVGKACVCDLRCNDGYWERNANGSYSAIDAATCRDHVEGGCTRETCESVTTVPNKPYACVCEVDRTPTCEEVGYYVKVGGVYQKKTEACTGYTRQDITYDGKTVKDACVCNPCNGCLMSKTNTDGSKGWYCMTKAEMNEYDDLYLDTKTGYCQCYGVVRTQTLSADANTSAHSFVYGKIDRDKDKNCSRLQSYRQLEYTIPVNFWCPRYMLVSDTMEADDFVVQPTTPAGVGSSSPAVLDHTWKAAHDNRIYPKASSGKIKKGTAKIVVQDRWLGEVGLSRGGYFYFTQASKWTPPRNKEDMVPKAVAKFGAASKWPAKLKASVKWASGSSRQSPVGKYVCKKGAKSTTKKDCSKYCKNWTGPY